MRCSDLHRLINVSSDVFSRRPERFFRSGVEDRRRGRPAKRLVYFLTDTHHDDAAVVYSRNPCLHDIVHPTDNRNAFLASSFGHPNNASKPGDAWTLAVSHFLYNAARRRKNK